MQNALDGFAWLFLTSNSIGRELLAFSRDQAILARFRVFDKPRKIGVCEKLTKESYESQNCLRQFGFVRHIIRLWNIHP